MKTNYLRLCVVFIIFNIILLYLYKLATITTLVDSAKTEKQISFFLFDVHVVYDFMSAPNDK